MQNSEFDPEHVAEYVANLKDVLKTAEPGKKMVILQQQLRWRQSDSTALCGPQSAEDRRGR